MADHSLRLIAIDFQSSSCVVWPFLLFPLLNIGFLITALLLRPLLIRLQRTLDGSIEGPDASLRSCVVFSASLVFLNCFVHSAHCKHNAGFFLMNEWFIGQCVQWLFLNLTFKKHFLNKWPGHRIVRLEPDNYFLLSGYPDSTASPEILAYWPFSLWGQTLDHQTIAGGFPDYEINHLKPTCGKIAPVFYVALFLVKNAALQY